MNMVDLSAMYDETLNPEALDFTTKPGRVCVSCLFARQRVSACNAAVELALRAGMESCDAAPVVYVLTPRDPRQLHIDEVLS